MKIFVEGMMGQVIGINPRWQPVRNRELLKIKFGSVGVLYLKGAKFYKINVFETA